LVGLGDLFDVPGAVRRARSPGGSRVARPVDLVPALAISAWRCLPSLAHSALASGSSSSRRICLILSSSGVTKNVRRKTPSVMPHLLQPSRKSMAPALPPNGCAAGNSRKPGRSRDSQPPLGAPLSDGRPNAKPGLRSGRTPSITTSCIPIIVCCRWIKSPAFLNQTTKASRNSLSRNASKNVMATLFKRISDRQQIFRVGKVTVRNGQIFPLRALVSWWFSPSGNRNCTIFAPKHPGCSSHVAFSLPRPCLLGALVVLLAVVLSPLRRYTRRL
jgi:hypothetical protein